MAANGCISLGVFIFNTIYDGSLKFENFHRGRIKLRARSQCTLHTIKISLTIKGLLHEPRVFQIVSSQMYKWYQKRFVSFLNIKFL